MILTAVVTTITIGLRPWHRSGRWQKNLLLTCTALTGFMAAPVHAQTVWTGFIDDEWNAALNWDPAVVPNAATEVLVDSTYANAPVIDGGITANAASINIGGTAYPSILSIDGSSTLLTSGGPSFLGFGLDEEGQIDIEAGSVWNSADNVFIGFDGTGHLNVTDSSVISGASAYLGLGEDGTGVVTLDNSNWAISNLLAVGGAGDGALLAQNNSVLTSLEGRLGGLEGSEGTATIATGSTWTVTDELFVGDGGGGRLYVLSGGQIASDVGILGVQSGSYGLASVRDLGTSWATSALGVGYGGIGQLRIFDQAQVAVGTDAFVGVEETGTGSITVETQGNLAITGSLNVGVDGHATVTVQNGGTMSSAGGTAVGVLGNGIGDIFVDGAGSGWTNTGSLVLGDFGNGRLTVTDGAGITNISSTFLGLSEGGIGGLSVDNATFFTSDGLVVGGAGTGLMTITGGGTVTSAQNSGEARIGFGGTGDVVISDTGSSWTNHGQLFVGSMDIGGNAGQGALLVTDGAQFINNGIAWLGHSSGSTGQAVVSGGTWDNTSSLYVGNEGNGLLVIEDGGLVTATNATIAAAAGSTGQVVANGNGIVWSNSGGLAIGGAGQAELTIGDGAIVIAQGAITGAAFPTSSATVTVNGVLAGLGGVTFNAGSHLSGAGTVSAGAAGTTTMNGTIAPGNSIGTLTIFGNYVQNAGSTYEVEIDAAGNSDLIDVSAMATLNGGQVVVVPFPDFALATPYTILTAAGGVNGQFDPVAGSFSYFLSPELSYDPNNVYLTIQQSATFESAAMTPNQIATAQGADSLPTGNPVWTAIAMLPDAPAAQFAFDQLSGEVHGSVQTALIDDSRFVREAALDRIRDAFAGVGAANASVLAYGEEGPELVSSDADRFAVWGHGFGSWGRWDSDGNAAQLDRGTGGFFFGGDLPLGDWRVGAVAGYSSTKLDIDDRASSANVESWHLGFYGGTKWGDIAFRTGAAYSWHDVSTVRTAAFPGFADSLTGDYGAGTGQFFGELAYDMDLGTYRLEPFATLAYVHQSRSGFAEQGGAAALTASSAATDTGFTTLGLRGETEFDLGGTRMAAHATMGWRHAFGDATPNSTHAFAGGAPFTISGAPIARDAAVIEAGLDLRFSPQASFGLSYSGQLAGNAQSHGFTARLGVSF
ncbi:autotransporter domain-containing protein [Stappia sp. WLB 29]|uniref:autotransporter outer membrane beta-barrel domain-containing protein n=1 Tax=Stappia sp. WLB 29 TaxID=2925220 RepID=UPI0020BE321F|nr:autotransporter domain-containing protein [Stappia sp. WLB 29]